MCSYQRINIKAKEMSNTLKHKFNSKWKSGLIGFSEIPQSVKSGWNRHNGDRGESRNNRKQIIEKMVNEDFESEIWNNLTNQLNKI